MKYHITALFLVLSSSVLAASIQGAYAERDVPNHGHDRNKIGTKLVTSFHWGNLTAGQKAKVLAPQTTTFSQYGGTVNCNELVTAQNPCGGIGQYDMNDTTLHTSVKGPEPLGFLFCPSSCLEVDWTAAGYRSIRDIGGQNYHWSYGTMMACTYAGFCADQEKWGDPGDVTINIRNTPTNAPITIVASFYYTSQTGNTVKEIMYHNVMKGYG